MTKQKLCSECRSEIKVIFNRTANSRSKPVRHGKGFRKQQKDHDLCQKCFLAFIRQSKAENGEYYHGS